MGVAEREDESQQQDNLEPDTTDNELPNPDPDSDPDADPDADPDEGGAEDEEVVVSIGDEESPASEEEKAAPKWVKDLRVEQRRLKRENAELKAKLGTGQPSAQQPPKLPPEPTMAEHDYDEEAFKAAMRDWYAKKKDVESFEASQKTEAEARQKAVQAVHENYAKSKQALGVKNFQELEDEVMAQLSQVQQSILIQGAANPAAVVAALGANPKKLQDLASIKDPVKFTWAAAQLETKVNVSKRTTTKPAPETTVRSGGSGATSKATLERLEAEAERTGDRSKVIAYKRQQKAAGK